MDRKAIKEEAKAKIKGNLWTIWKALLVVSLVSFGISFVAGILDGAIFGNEENAMTLFSSLATLAVVPLSVGSISYILKFSRGEKPEVKEVFDFYKNILPILGVTILVSIFVSLGFILLIVPGIIVSFMLCMTTYMMAEGRTDVWQIIKDSAAMMKGHKWEYFVFGLSFIGWILLCGITLGIASIYVIPYMSTAQCIWYDKLKALNNK